jgi:GT2 family glycosyltransferase/lipopolysaccharide/colanic/teichoic acid biosynthesis glycosyltransferase
MNASLDRGPLAGVGIETPRVSLVIVHFRTPEVLEVCLEKIAQARISVPWEAIVVDNAPLDDAAERIAHGRSGVRYQRNERNIGFGRAVNQGIAQGRGEFFLVMNPDVEIAPGSVEELIAEAERDPAAGLVAPKLVYPDGTLQDSCRTFYTLPVFLLRRTFIGRLFPNHRLLREHLMLDFDHAHTRTVDWCIGASLLARRRAVDDVGPMDERFFLYFEDVDWCYRMQARGWKVVYHPAATMLHRYARESARKPGRGLWLHLASTFRYYEKWSFVLYWFKRRSSAIRRIALVLSDFLAVNLAFALAYVARELTAGILTKPTFGFGRYARFLVFSDAVALLSLALAGMYRSRRSEEAGEQVLGAARALLATALIMMASTFLFSTPVYSRAVVGAFLPLALLLILSFRWGIFRIQGSIRSRRLHLRRIGLLAPEADAAEILRRQGRHADLGLDVLPLTSRAAVLERPRGATPGAIEDAVVLWVQDERIAEVVLFEDWPGGPIDALVARLAAEGIAVRLVPRARAALHGGARMGDFLGFPALQVAGSSPTARSWEKRLIDAAAAAVSILLLLVPYLIARLICAAAGKPMVAREVIGRRGRRLRLLHLPIRGLAPLRNYPVLLRWLTGEWSVVGIHPFDAELWPELPESYRRFAPDAAPGWVTLANPPGQSVPAVCAANQEYVARWSLALDLNLLLERIKHRKGDR